MKLWLVCVSCARRSPIDQIHDPDGTPYAVCAHCLTKNKLHKLRSYEGGPPEFTVIGKWFGDDAPGKTV